jgi:hypothetical protein
VSIDIGGSALDSRDLVEQGPAIAERQRLASSASDAHAIPRPPAGLEPDKVISYVMKLVFHPLRSRLADAYHADERPDARNDAQHRQDTSDFVPEQRLEGFPHNRIEEHCWSR